MKYSICLFLFLLNLAACGSDSQNQVLPVAARPEDPKNIKPEEAILMSTPTPTPTPTPPPLTVKSTKHSNIETCSLMNDQSLQCYLFSFNESPPEPPKKVLERVFSYLITDRLDCVTTLDLNNTGFCWVPGHYETIYPATADSWKIMSDGNSICYLNPKGFWCVGLWENEYYASDIPKLMYPTNPGYVPVGFSSTTTRITLFLNDLIHPIVVIYNL